MANQQKRAAALREVRLLQKRARDKEYHLRKRGAVGIKMGSPRLNFSEVRGMNLNELRKYSRDLSNFTATRMTVLPHGDVVPEAMILETRRNVAQYNHRVEQERRKLQRKVRTPEISEDLQRSPNFQEIHLENKPRNEQEANRLLKRSRQWKHSSPSMKLRGQRRAAVKMLRQIGLDHEANQLGNLRSDLFDRLVNQGGLLEDAALWYQQDREKIEEEIGYNPDDFGLFQSRLSNQLNTIRRNR